MVLLWQGLRRCVGLIENESSPKDAVAAAVDASKTSPIDHDNVLALSLTPFESNLKFKIS